MEAYRVFFQDVFIVLGAEARAELAANAKVNAVVFIAAAAAAVESVVKYSNECNGAFDISSAGRRVAIWTESKEWQTRCSWGNDSGSEEDKI